MNARSDLFNSKRAAIARAAASRIAFATRVARSQVARQPESQIRERKRGKAEKQRRDKSVADLTRGEGPSVSPLRHSFPRRCGSDVPIPSYVSRPIELDAADNGDIISPLSLLPPIDASHSTGPSKFARARNELSPEPAIRVSR